MVVRKLRPVPKKDYGRHLMAQLRIGKYVRASCTGCSWKMEGEYPESVVRAEFERHT